MKKMVYLLMLCILGWGSSLYAEEKLSCEGVFTTGIESEDDLDKSTSMIEKLSQEEVFLGSLFDMSVGVSDGYTLREHIGYINRHYNMYFSFLDESYREFISLVSVLHDLGKPISAILDLNGLQKQYTSGVLDNFSIRKILELSPSTYILAVSVIEGGLGGYFQGDWSVSELVSSIQHRASLTGKDSCDFLYLLTVFYQCDAGSYTHEIGAKPRLEDLFSYDGEDKKIFLADKRRLKFSDKLERMYRDLEIKLGCSM